ncbi:hypothetical protein [Capybara microvirus Cap3_SP_446]|nr:hypothetical protein [Capybara microvirus Cap3_SP_446]
MVNNLYTIYDTLSQRYGSVVAFASDGMALFSIAQSYQASGEVLDRYELCRVGTVDIETGVVESSGAPVRLAWSSRPQFEQKMTDSVKDPLPVPPLPKQ